MAFATNATAQGVIDVHSHIITPDFASALGSEGRLSDEGYPLPEWNVEEHRCEKPTAEQTNGEM